MQFSPCTLCPRSSRHLSLSFLHRTQSRSCAGFVWSTFNSNNTVIFVAPRGAHGLLPGCHRRDDFIFGNIFVVAFSIADNHTFIMRSSIFVAQIDVLWPAFLFSRRCKARVWLIGSVWAKNMDTQAKQARCGGYLQIFTPMHLLAALGQSIRIGR